MKTKPSLVLPIETKAREFDAKIYLAGLAAEKGFNVVLGEQNAILKNVGRLPKGIYFDKSLARAKVAAFKRLRKLGYRLVANCEEGLVYRSPSFYLHERVMVDAFEQVEKFFAWGDVQSDLIGHYLRYDKEKIITTGNPRFDLLLPKFHELYHEDAQKIKKQHGQFVLINTNFARYNHYYGHEKLLEIMKKRGIIDEEDDLSFFQEWHNFIGEVFHSFTTLLEKLSEDFKEMKFIIRPHPSENHQPWCNLATNLQNVEVHYQGAVIPWILACDALIHNSCTTGVEAALLGKPVLAYREVVSKVYDSYLPNLMSENSYTYETLKDCLQSTIAGDYTPTLQNKSVESRVKRYIKSYKNSESVDLIIEELVKLAMQESHQKPSVIPNMMDYSYQFTKDVARKIKCRFSSNDGYSSQKFPDFSCNEVQSQLDKLGALSGKFSKVRARPFCQGIALVSKKESVF